MEIYYVRKLGRKKFAPYVTVGIAGDTFEARIDTGADLTIVPEHLLDQLQPSGIVKIGAYDGSMKDVPAYKGTVNVVGKDIYLDEIITTTSDIGTLGLDVLDHFAMLFEQGKVLLEPID